MIAQDAGTQEEMVFKNRFQEQPVDQQDAASRDPV